MLTQSLSFSPALTALIAIINTVLSLLPNGQTYFQTTSAILGNMYANTFMSLLNSRVRFARPSGYVDDEASQTYLTYDQPIRSALVFARSAGGGEGDTGTVAEGEGDGEEYGMHDHDERRSRRRSLRSTRSSGMATLQISEEDRRKRSLSLSPISPDTLVASVCNLSYARTSLTLLMPCCVVCLAHNT